MDSVGSRRLPAWLPHDLDKLNPPLRALVAVEDDSVCLLGVIVDQMKPYTSVCSYSWKHRAVPCKKCRLPVLGLHLIPPWRNSLLGTQLLTPIGFSPTDSTGRF